MHKYIFFLLITFFGLSNLIAQTSQSEKRWTIQWKNISLLDAFRELTQKIGVEFSYSSDVHVEKKIDYNGRNKNITEIVKSIVGSNYKVELLKNYFIITKAPQHEVEVNLIIQDSITDMPIPYVSILSSERWVSAMTNEAGVATISFLSTDRNEKIQIRHINYRDTTIILHDTDTNRKILLTQKVDTLETIVLIGKLQKSFWGFLMPKYLKRQSLNLHDFFKKGPAQFSLLPGLSSRGRLQSQSINNVSVNVIGGYSMGTNGVEFGGLFNLSQGSSHALQIGGLTNMVGGSFSGLQIAGLHNNVIDTVRGVQISLMSNKTEGVLKGVQLSPFYNEAGVNRGLQIGLINSSDSSTGYSFGLLNFVKSGKFGVHVFTSDFFTTGIGYRTGTKRSFTELVVGYRDRNLDRYIMAGLVMGTNIPFSKKVGLELSIGGYLGMVEWRGYSGTSLLQYNALLHIPLYKDFTFLGGLSRYTHYNIYNEMGDINKSWWGWQTGIAWFYNQNGKYSKPMFKNTDWSFSAAITQGTNLDFNSPVYGFDFQIKRKLDTRVYLQLTSGYSYYGGSDVGYYLDYNSDYNSYKFSKKGIYRTLVGLSFYPKNQNRFYIGSGLGFLYLHKPSFSYSPYVGWDFSTKFSLEAQLLGTNFGNWVYSTGTINLRYYIFR